MYSIYSIFIYYLRLYLEYNQSVLSNSIFPNYLLPETRFTCSIEYGVLVYGVTCIHLYIIIRYIFSTGLSPMRKQSITYVLPLCPVWNCSVEWPGCSRSRMIRCIDLFMWYMAKSTQLLVNSQLATIILSEYDYEWGVAAAASSCSARWGTCFLVLRSLRESRFRVPVLPRSRSFTLKAC